jgi:putative ABC transport system permease protein
MSAVATLRVAGFVSRRTITRGNRGVALLTIVMMAVIFAELLFIPSLIQGATDHIEQVLRENVTADVAITPAQAELTIPDPDSLLEQARTTPGVLAATATTVAGSQVSAGNRSGSWSVVAVDPASYAETFATPQEMIEGTFLAPGDADDVVLGLGIAGADRTDTVTYPASLQSVHAGDEVTVTLVGGQTHRFRVRGIYDTGLSQANLRAFIPAATAERLVPALDGQATAVFVNAQDLGDEAEIIASLQQSRPDLTYEPWQTLTSTVEELTGSFDSIRSILNAVSLLVAAIAVFIVTYVDLVSKRRTIGIERAIGISGSAIVLSYVLKAVVFAIIGVIAGAALFTFVAVPIVNEHPFRFPIGPVTLSVTAGETRRAAVVLVVVAALGAMAPAWRSVRLRILDAIWG